jgi:hypothetical protein
LPLLAERFDGAGLRAIGAERDLQREMRKIEKEEWAEIFAAWECLEELQVAWT